MLVPVRWLRDYVDFPWSPHELAERMTMSGSKVEAVRSPGLESADIRAGRIVSAERHPNSDHLWVCRVDIGGRIVQSVSGAPNTAPGLLVPVALPGTKLSGSMQAIRAGEVRGVLSEAVLCSEAELGVSDDHSGLMELSGDISPGDDLVRGLGLDDAVIEFEISPNRPDCLSVVGLAREVAALSGGALRLPPLDPPESEPHASELAKVRVEAPHRCRRYIARVIRGARIAPSPLWLQSRLRAAGMRPINNVVDVTNYVMLELGQPLHAFDLARLANAEIVVRMARPGETMTTLDGAQRSFCDDDLLICDAERPVAVAGVMGGLDSEVTLETRDILLESASFEPTGVRRTSRRLGLRTEASHRFEKDLDPHLAELAVDRAARLIAELAGGSVAKGRIDVHSGLPAPRTLRVRPQRVNRMLGTCLSPAEMKRILEALEFGVEIENDGEQLAVAVPTFRRDVEGEADIAEEVSRIYGFDRIEPTLPKGASAQGGLSLPLPAIERVRDVLVAQGFAESITFSFISPKGYDRLQLPADHPWRRSIELANPLSEEQSVMRTTLIPSLLGAASLNARRRQPDVRLFEVGKVYIAERLPLESLPDERWTLALVLSGAAPSLGWGESSRPADFYDLKGAVEAVLEALGAEAAWEPAEQPHLHPGRTAAIVVSGSVVGYLGELHPKAAEAFELRNRVYVCEIDLEPLIAASGRPVQFQSLPKYPAVDRDLALLVPVHVRAADVVALIERHGGEYLRSVSLFDVYEGKQVPQGMRSLAYTMTFQAGDRTLTDEEISKVLERLEEKLKSGLGVEVRS